MSGNPIPQTREERRALIKEDPTVLCEWLKGLAQNDYMIDGRFLPDGEMLYQAADEIRTLTSQVTVLSGKLSLLREKLWFLEDSEMR